jgi:lysyl-tRNA synthetase class II
VFDDLVHNLEARRRGIGGDVPGGQRLSGLFIDQEDAADRRFGSLESLQDKLGDLGITDVFHPQMNEVIGGASARPLKQSCPVRSDQL